MDDKDAEIAKLTAQLAAAKESSEELAHKVNVAVCLTGTKIDKIAALREALSDIRRVAPSGLTISAADAFYKCQEIADRALS